MNDWFMSNLGDPMLADESLNQIKSCFSSQCDSSKNANHMAVFFRHESIGGVHCELKVYFSPAALNVAKVFDAAPCQQPSVNDLGLLAGSEESWLFLFPS